ncbi:MAG: FG-GAP-like repeat-containing protein [Verrucomicrobiales bacterium]|nr:FG-GAP-like repeat-containing protein [Verrucomicrobiales bacterium]
MKINLTFIAMCVLGCQLQAQVSFTLSSSPGVGNQPWMVVATDVNGDGKMDLISANGLDNTLTVLTNNGSGGFVLASSPAVGNTPIWVTAADVSGDGKAELICVNNSDNSLSVLTNNGSGGFVISSTHAVGNDPRMVTAADVNGDGKADLISVNGGNNTLTVLTNNGSGGFVLASSPGVGSNPYSVVAADVNGDGKVDLISANINGNTLTVLTNNGGGFALASSPGVGSGPYGITAADVNGDGKVDLINANAYGSSLSVLTNNGGGGFALASSPGVGNYPCSVTAADISGDGKVDLINVNQFDNTLSVFTNKGGGEFALAALPGVGSSSPNGVIAVDVNGDGKLDLISANFHGNNLSILTNATPFSQITPPCDPAPSNLISWWRAEGNANNVAGGPSGLVYPGTGYANGEVGQAFSFDGVTGCVMNTNTPPMTNIQNSFTMEFWAYPQKGFDIAPENNSGYPGISGQSYAIFPDWGGLDGQAGVGVCVGTNGISVIEHAHDYMPSMLSYTNLINGWIHVAVVYVNKQPTLYVNGVNVRTGITSSRSFVYPSKDLGNSYGSVFGHPFDSYGPYQGLLDEVGIYNRALSAAEIAAIYNAGSAGKCVPANPPLPVPIITAFSPASATNGVSITLTGTNFSPVAANNTVYFGAVQAAVTDASVTNLTVVMPTGATFVPITVTVNGLTAYANQPFLPTFSGSGMIDSSSLAARLDLPAGTGPGKVVIADLDGDGKPDLAIADSSIAKISIYRNISTSGSLTAGSFASRVVLPLLLPSSGSSPFTIAAADVDGDGRLDLIALNADNNVVSILRNIGSPGSLTTNSFAARIDLPAGTFLRGLAVQDLNGDGKPEIVTASQTSPGGVSIFQNTSTIGNIAFAARVNFVTGNGSASVAIGDLDGDSKPDLVVGNYYGNTLSVFRNLGTGNSITTNSFASGVDFPALATCFSIAIGDMDGDGKLDLLIGGAQNSQAFSVYRNTSSVGSITTSSFAARVDFAAPGWVNTLTLADLDGDGKLDIALATQLPSVFSIFKNVSVPGSFTPTSLMARVDYSAGYNPVGISVGDLDGDGRPDITFGNFYDATISIYRNLVPFATAPSITSQPTNQTVTVGGVANFNVTATGTAPLIYQWKFNGTNIIGATNDTLTLSNVQLADAGIYSVQVENAVDSALSSNAVLTVAVPSCTSAPSGLVSWWRAEGNALDSIGGNNGFVTNGVISYSAGKVGSAFHYNGGGGFVQVPASPSLNVGLGAGFTLEGWIQPGNLINQLPLFEWQFDGVQNGVHFWISAVGGAGCLYANVMDTANNPHSFSTPAGILSSGYQHVALTYDKATGLASLYRNGVLVANSNLGVFTPRTTGNLLLGARTYLGGALQFNYVGDLDEMSIYSRALSAPEIAAIYTAGSAGKCTSSSLDSGLLLHYPFDGNALDTSGNNHNGQVNGAALCPDRFGTANSAYSFNGSSAYILVPDQSKQLNFDARSNYYTIAFWLNLSNVTTRQELIMDRGSVGNPHASYDLFFDPTYGLIASCWDGIINLEVASVTHLVSNQWYHVAMVDEGGTIKLYVNGNRELAQGEPGAPTNMPSGFGSTVNTQTNRSIGRFAGLSYGNYFKGALDDVRIYGHALSASEIQQLAASPINSPPAITNQPTSVTNYVGSTVSFSVGATGTTPLSYQWKLNGTNIPGATGLTLMIPNVQFTDAGNYSVLITNIAGSVLSSNATLNVVEPTLNDGLLLHYPFDGNALDASGNGHDGQVNGAVPVPDRFGKNNSAYSFNGQNFYLIVPDIAKQLNFDARSNYYTVATWVNLASLAQREELIMDRASPNNPPCSYRLFFDPGYGFVANCWDGLVNVEVASTTFPQSNRWYYVVMVDEGGTLKLYVNGNREFAAAEPGAPTNVPSNYGSTINGEASRTIGRFAPAYNNYLNGAVDDVRIYSRALSTNEIQQLYTAPPVITSQPANLLVTVGDNATFSITAMGTDPLNYQWNFKGLPIDGATNASLTLSNVQVSDAGTYFVTVTNLYGSGTSSNAVLKVNNPPVADASATTPLVISVNNSNATVVLDGSLSFDPDGDSLQYYWYQTGALDPLAAGIVAVVALPVGTNSITLLVNDGLASNQNTIAVEVITLAQAVDRLKDAVADVSQKQSLIAILNAALASIDRSNPTAAINQFQAFQNQVSAQISPLDPELAQSLIDAAQSIINALSGGGEASNNKALKASSHANGKIHLNFSGMHQQIYIIEASTNLVDWEKIGVAKDQGDGTFDFDDLNAVKMSGRFYRVVAP